MRRRIIYIILAASFCLTVFMLWYCSQRHTGRPGELSVFLNPTILWDCFYAGIILWLANFFTLLASVPETYRATVIRRASAVLLLIAMPAIGVFHIFSDIGNATRLVASMRAPDSHIYHVFRVAFWEKSLGVEVKRNLFFLNTRCLGIVPTDLPHYQRLLRPAKQPLLLTANASWPDPKAPSAKHIEFIFSADGTKLAVATPYEERAADTARYADVWLLYDFTNHRSYGFADGRGMLEVQKLPPDILLGNSKGQP
jgi:hypothetical protein